MKLNKLVTDYIEYVDKTTSLGNKLGRKLVKILKPIIPDISYSLGWEEGGIDTVCLWSENGSVTSVILKSPEDIYKYKGLEAVITEVIPELEYLVDCPFGIYLTKEKAERVKKALKEELK